MAKEDNLKPIKKGELSKEEAKARGSLGGKASVESRRAKKTLKEELKILLEVLEESGENAQNKMCIALLQEANKGNVKAFEVIRDTIGEKPVEVSESTVRVLGLRVTVNPKRESKK